SALILFSFFGSSQVAVTKVEFSPCDESFCTNPINLDITLTIITEETIGLIVTPPIGATPGFGSVIYSDGFITANLSYEVVASLLDADFELDINFSQSPVFFEVNLGILAPYYLTDDSYAVSTCGGSICPNTVFDYSLDGGASTDQCTFGLPAGTYNVEFSPIVDGGVQYCNAPVAQFINAAVVQVDYTFTPNGDVIISATGGASPYAYSANFIPFTSGTIPASDPILPSCITFTAIDNSGCFVNLDAGYVIETCPGDFDGDGGVGVTDLSDFFSSVRLWCSLRKFRRF
ncbi:MAG: hypothetical protein AB8B53_15380, partial [Flavobacteriales bacterium]